MSSQRNSVSKTGEKKDSLLLAGEMDPNTELKAAAPFLREGTERLCRDSKESTSSTFQMHLLMQFCLLFLLYWSQTSREHWGFLPCRAPDSILTHWAADHKQKGGRERFVYKTLISFVYWLPEFLFSVSSNRIPQHSKYFPLIVYHQHVPGQSWIINREHHY